MLASTLPSRVTDSAALPRLVVRQQPSKARLCCFKEKVDRRPVDPPPIVQLVKQNTSGSKSDDDMETRYPYFFMYASLATAEGDQDLHVVNDVKTTAGSVVQSLHKLKDMDHHDSDGAFFVFADISVRLEGYYKLKFTLFEISGMDVLRVCSVLSDTFQVYSPKSFPGMSESTALTKSFSVQGVRVRIRKESRLKRQRSQIEEEPKTRRPSQSLAPQPSRSETPNVMSMQHLLLPLEHTTTVSSSPSSSTSHSTRTNRS